MVLGSLPNGTAISLVKDFGRGWSKSGPSAGNLRAGCLRDGAELAMPALVGVLSHWADRASESWERARACVRLRDHAPAVLARIAIACRLSSGPATGSADQHRSNCQSGGWRRKPGHNRWTLNDPHEPSTPENQRFARDAKRNQPPRSASKPRVSRLFSSHLALYPRSGSASSCNLYTRQPHFLQIYKSGVLRAALTCVLHNDASPAWRKRVWTKIRCGGRLPLNECVRARSTLRHYLPRLRLRHGRARRLSEHRH